MINDPMKPYEHLNRAAALLREVDENPRNSDRKRQDADFTVMLANAHIALAHAQMIGRSRA